jgi:NTE family protein
MFPCFQHRYRYNRSLKLLDLCVMLVVQAARKSAARQVSHGKIGLAIAGGGPIGGMYELGALRAMDNAIAGLDLTRLDAYVGVSSGAFLAAGLANRISTEEMTRIFITGDSTEIRFRPEIFLQPAFKEYLQRAVSVPAIFFDWWRDVLMDPTGSHLSDVVTRFSSVIPTGIFNNQEIEKFLRTIFTSRGRSNRFSDLDHKLNVVAVDLDSGEAVRFGDTGWDDVPISQAVQASAALPGLYSPVDIRGRHFVDGALRRTMHASVILDQGIDLMIGINPFVPFNASGAKSQPDGINKLSEGGLPVVLSQTFRTLLQSRMQVGLAKYAQQYPQTDQIVFEPNDDDGEMFFTNVFSFNSRQRVCELAYQTTLNDLRRRKSELAPILNKHGLHLRDSVLSNPNSSMLDGFTPTIRQTDTTARLRRTLDEIEYRLKR